MNHFPCVCSTWTACYLLIPISVLYFVTLCCALLLSCLHLWVLSEIPIYRWLMADVLSFPLSFPFAPIPNSLLLYRFKAEVSPQTKHLLKFQLYYWGLPAQSSPVCWLLGFSTLLSKPVILPHVSGKLFNSRDHRQEASFMPHNTPSLDSLHKLQFAVNQWATNYGIFWLDSSFLTDFSCLLSE